MSELTRSRLQVLDEEIARRCSTIIEQRPDWPCRRGCDSCCRSLSELPLLRAAEIARVREGFAALDAETRRKVEERFCSLEAAESGAEKGSVICPLLDREAGACLIYEDRPIACRTYGFYTERGGGRYCEIVEELEDEIERDGIILGNHASIERRLERDFGPAESLTLEKIL